MPQHVIQRGNNRQMCFQDPADRGAYLAFLSKYRKEHEVDIHAWVLMDNHTHLLVTPRKDDSLSRFMKALGQRYAQYFNFKYERTGTLWEGRFKSCLVDTESYFLQCQRYIELNPVKAGMVDNPEDYRWSSYLYHAYGLRAKWHTPHDCYLNYQPDPDLRQASYRSFVASSPPPGTDDLIFYTAISGKALGTETFREEMNTRYGV
ncbi:transposase [Marinobacter confluentis]|uniref:Transposase n=1 Tax=Marinobacter confluentis TaxID=1697557 RepID=A0A4Z1CIK9_9GAMM|nr:transposase [Marinobacter confluentis]